MHEGRDLDIDLASFACAVRERRRGAAVLAVIDYLVAENRVLREQLSGTGRRMRLTDEQRRDLAVLGRALKPALRSYISIVKPETRAVPGWPRARIHGRRGYPCPTCR